MIIVLPFSSVSPPSGTRLGIVMIPPSIVAICVLPSETSTSIDVAGAVTAVAPVPVVHREWTFYMAILL
jgi:hypothetical protein